MYSDTSPGGEDSLIVSFQCVQKKDLKLIGIKILVQWSACSPSTLTIRVRFSLMCTGFSVNRIEKCFFKLF